MSIQEARLSRLYKWANGETAPPLKAVIYLSNHCNLNCLFCTGSLNPDRNTSTFELTKKQWIRIALDGIRMGIKEWWITGGGEPLIRDKTLIKIIKIIKDSEDSYCFITTNGTLFKEKLIKELVKLRVDRINFSIDAPNPRTNDFLRGKKGAFEQAINSIGLFKEYKNKLFTKKPYLCITSVLTSKNYNKISNLINLAHIIGCDEVRLQPLMIFKETHLKIKELILPYQKINFQKEKELSIKHGIKFDLTEIEKNNGKKKQTKKIVNNLFLSSFCFEPWYSILIDQQGNIGPCCSWDKGEENINITKKSLKEIWYGKFFNYIRGRMKTKKPLKNCLNCGMINESENLRTKLIKLNS